MGLSKGQTNNPNGRPKGSSNASTREIKQAISDKTTTAELVEKLLVLSDHPDPKVAITAIKILIEYKHGMPQRGMDLNIVDHRSHKDIIQGLQPPK